MTLTIPLEKIGKAYAPLRLINPKAEAALLKSVKQYGQLSPVIVAETGTRQYEMIDGFKRLRVFRKLSFKTLHAKPLEANQSLKAAIIYMNREFRSITDLEEGLVITSLHREDKINQTVIAEMLGHHKSWVCRRIALVERLSDEVLEHIRLGLITPTIGRELSKLPRGNQHLPLQTITSRRLTTRQTARLVTLLQNEPEARHQTLLDSLDYDVLETPKTNSSPAADKTDKIIKVRGTELIHEKLKRIECLLSRLLSTDLAAPCSHIEDDAQKRFVALLTIIRHSLEVAHSRLVPSATPFQTPKSSNG